MAKIGRHGAAEGCAATLVAVLLAGCAASAPEEPAVTPAEPAPSARTAPATSAPATSARALPAGEGRSILEQDCTNCHDLNGLWAYRGYYNEERWRAMILTMVEHGADLDEAEIAALTSYLAEHFGPGTR